MSPQTPSAETAALLAELRRVPLFAALGEKESGCVAQAEELRLEKGETLVREGDEASRFYTLLEGEFSVSKNYGGQETVLARYLPGHVFRRGAAAARRAVCGDRARRIRLPADRLSRARSSGSCSGFAPPSPSADFPRHAARLRNLEGSAQQREKLAALGTMSAGLAHELNNPSAAARRAAVHLEDAVLGIQDVGQRLHHSLESGQWRELIAFVGEALSAAAARAGGAVEQSDREERMAAALRAKGVAEAWQIAPALASALPDIPALKRLAEKLPPGRAARCAALDRRAAEHPRAAG